ncbi:hypothetical protein Scep_019970 [Stephania cephalantha]|uniref:Uncharacterized protein n=1 Tax=Stephania cephalantha TaxID=152367 RepID=A0AAP0NQD6_9MAGN
MLSNDINKRVFAFRRGCRSSADGRVGVRVADESSQRRPKLDQEERKASKGGGARASNGANERVAEPWWWPAAELDGTRGDGKGGQSRQANTGAGGEDHAAASAPDDNLEQGRHDSRCRRRALRRKDRAGESRSTSTISVDDDGDGGGGERPAAAKKKEILFA